MKNKPFLPFEQVLTIFIVLGCFSFFFISAFTDIPESQKANVSEIRSALQVLLGMVVSYWVGTTKSSQKKSDTIDKLTNQPPVETAQ